jgi:hypothetical protein
MHRIIMMKTPQAAFYCLQIAAITGVTLLLQGCAERKTRTHQWAAAITVHPRNPVPAPGYEPTAIDDTPPDLQWELPPPPSHLVTVRQPLRPRSTPQPAPEPSGNAKTDAPLLAPQLSEQEITAAKQQMNESVAVARKNLATAKSHRLNAMQIDLASKVNSFLDESRDAAKYGDWTRARNLAKKAQVLSEELTASL